MSVVALVGLVDQRGWLLLQERDDRTPVDPDKWSLVGGRVEGGETPAMGARRELDEETGIRCDDLAPLGAHRLPCAVHGTDNIELFTASTRLTDADVHCTEGRQIVFVAPERIADLDLTDSTRELYRLVLAAHQS